MSKVFPLRCEAKKYAWGKYGSTSAVAQLMQSSLKDVVVEEDTPYAELWMGTHKAAPSIILSPTGTAAERPLSDELKAHPEFLGQKVMQLFGKESTGDHDQLPFLFKVLSVRTPLSIQAHPNKTRAEELHRQRPDLYGDPNHKPELAVALTEFHALCGFRPIRQIVEFIRDVPELRSLVGQSNFHDLEQSTVNNMTDDHSIATREGRAALKKCFTAVMSSPKDSIEKHLKILVKKLKETAEKGITGDNMSTSCSRLVLQVHEDFPGDVGCFAVYFLNYLCLEPGEALYLSADEAHAYLSGDCIEIMACSDNVVRAGLTPKFIDVHELCEMLTYECSPSKNKIFKEVSEDSFNTIFDPPVPDFTLAKIQVPSTEKVYTFKPKDAASIILVIEGHGKYDCLGYGTREFVRGSTIFVPAYETLTVDIGSNSSDLLAFQAYCQL